MGEPRCPALPSFPGFTHLSPVPYTPPSYGWPGLTLRLALRGAVNPRLALDLMKALWAFRRRGWWRLPPFLPLPDAAYLRWRMYTAYADESAVPPVEDVVRFSRWRRETMGM